MARVRFACLLGVALLVLMAGPSGEGWAQAPGQPASEVVIEACGAVARPADDPDGLRLARLVRTDTDLQPGDAGLGCRFVVPGDPKAGPVIVEARLSRPALVGSGQALDRWFVLVRRGEPTVVSQVFAEPARSAAGPWTLELRIGDRLVAERHFAFRTETPPGPAVAETAAAAPPAPATAAVRPPDRPAAVAARASETSPARPLPGAIEPVRPVPPEKTPARPLPAPLAPAAPPVPVRPAARPAPSRPAAGQAVSPPPSSSVKPAVGRAAARRPDGVTTPRPAQAAASRPVQAVSSRPVPVVATPRPAPTPRAGQAPAGKVQAGGRKPSTPGPQPLVAPAKPAREAAENGYVALQTGVFAEPGNAWHQASQLRGRGFPACVSVESGPAGKRYRVLAGRFGDRRTAVRYRSEVAAATGGKAVPQSVDRTMAAAMRCQ